MRRLEVLVQNIEKLGKKYAGQGKNSYPAAVG